MYGTLRSRAGRSVVFPLLMLFVQIVLSAASDASTVQQRPSAPTVVLHTSKTLYRAGEAITVVITNSSRSPVLIFGGGFFCTIVQLQRSTSSGWTTFENCLSESPSAPVALDGGKAMRLTFSPNPRGTQSGLAPGVYRFTVMFQAGAGLEDESVAYSRPFTIR